MNFFTLKNDKGKDIQYEVLHAFRRNNEQFMIYKECSKKKCKPLSAKYTVINNKLFVLPILDEKDKAMVNEEMVRVLA